MASIPIEIKLMGQIAKRLKIWLREHPDDKYYPSSKVNLKIRNHISIKIEFAHLDDLIKMKQAARRPKDAEDLKFLRRLKQKKRNR